MRQNHYLIHSTYGFALLIVSLVTSACPSVTPPMPNALHAPDNACGPKCIRALMQITGLGDFACDVDCIYRHIGKPSSEPTTMKDLKYALHKLGFSAEGVKLNIAELRGERGYAIVPLGRPGDPKDAHKHFVLVCQVMEDSVICTDGESSERRLMQLSHFEQMWNGYALIMRQYGGRLLEKDMNTMGTPRGSPDKKYEAIKDLGEVDMHTVLKHSFEMEVREYEPCSLRIIGKSCSCLDADLQKGEDGRATLSLSTKASRPGMQLSSAAVELLPSRVVKQYAIRAYVRNSYRMQPNKAYLQVTDTKPTTYPVVIEYYVSGNDHIEFDHMSTEIGHLTAGQVDSKVEADGDAKRYTFTVPLVYAADDIGEKARYVHGIVTFVMHTTRGRIEMPLDFTAAIGTDTYVISPEKAFLIASKSTNSDPISISLTFKETAPHNISITQTDTTCPLLVETKPVAEGEFVLYLQADCEKIRNLPNGLHEWEIGVQWSDGLRTAVITLPASVVVLD